MKLQFCKQTQLWSVSSGIYTLYQGNINPWKTPKVLHSVLAQHYLIDRFPADAVKQPINHKIPKLNLYKTDQDIEWRKTSTGCKRVYVEQFGKFWSLSFQQWNELCQLGAQSGFVSLEDYKILKHKPRHIRLINGNYVSLDQTRPVFSIRHWHQSEFKQSLKQAQVRQSYSVDQKEKLGSLISQLIRDDSSESRHHNVIEATI